MRVWKGTQISIQLTRDFIRPIQNSQNEFRGFGYENASASTARILNNYSIARNEDFAHREIGGSWSGFSLMRGREGFYKINFNLRFGRRRNGRFRLHRRFAARIIFIKTAV